METRNIPDEGSMRDLGRDLSGRLHVGDVVLLEGQLGAGKTTLVRGVLEGIGYRGKVRSPTFNLIQTFASSPPVMHADLYRVQGIEGLGMEDYLDSHICFIEWAERSSDYFDLKQSWRIHIGFSPDGRVVRIIPPGVKLAA